MSDFNAVPSGAIKKVYRFFFFFTYAVVLYRTCKQTGWYKISGVALKWRSDVLWSEKEEQDRRMRKVKEEGFDLG